MYRVVANSSRNRADSSGTPEAIEQVRQSVEETKRVMVYMASSAGSLDELREFASDAEAGLAAQAVQREFFPAQFVQILQLRIRPNFRKGEVLFNPLAFTLI